MNETNLRYVLFCTKTFGIVMILIAILLMLKRYYDLDDSLDNSQTLYMSYRNQLDLSISDDLSPIGCRAINEYLDVRHVSSEPVLFIYYSVFSGSARMDYLLRGVETFFPDYESNEHVLFVASGFKTEPQIKYGHTVVLTPGENLGLKSEKSSEPFLCIYLNGRVFHVYTPRSPYDSLYETYLTAIKHKYFPALSAFSPRVFPATVPVPWDIVLNKHQS